MGLIAGNKLPSAAMKGIVSTITKAEISDTLLERPLSFTFSGRRYFIYPLSLGKIHLCSRLIEDLGLTEATRDDELYKTIIHAADEDKDKCLRLISYITLPGSDCIDEGKVVKRISGLSKMEADDIASLIAYVLCNDKTSGIKREFGIDTEEKQLSKVLDIKKRSNDGSSVTFGCKSIWGALIDFACERYGWTYQYVLWGISYSALQLMIADHSRSLFLSKDERKKARLQTDGITLRAEDTSSLIDFIKTQNWS